MSERALYHCIRTTSLFVEGLEVGEWDVKVKRLDNEKIEELPIPYFKQYFRKLTLDYLAALKKIADKQANKNWHDDLCKLEQLYFNYK
ncbi:hypothetical protein [Bacillus subtilis]|uniref:hypothetical protein n=1 Tax=Bacillus subtilis TaxID=1423 RepID=UPI001BA128AA|nr:hypothetical protein [Bacillus subtilis]CAI6330972.1 hypothetical protein NRS6096_22275 [Bacillus subtilis]